MRNSLVEPEIAYWTAAGFSLESHMNQSVQILLLAFAMIFLLNFSPFYAMNLKVCSLETSWASFLVNYCLFVVNS